MLPPAPSNTRSTAEGAVMDAKRIRVTDFATKKRQGEKIVMLTAYDATMARLFDRAGVEALLVGDSLGTVILGLDTTLPVTLDAMVHHTRAVSRGAERALVIADMPFLTFQVGVADAVRNAGRLLQEGGAAAVKLEGGRPVLDVVKRLVDVGIPVMGHLGLQPQSVHQAGGYVRRRHSRTRRRRCWPTHWRCRTPARSPSCSRRYLQTWRATPPGRWQCP